MNNSYTTNKSKDKEKEGKLAANLKNKKQIESKIDEKQEFFKELTNSVIKAVNKLRKQPKYLIPFLEKKKENFKDEFLYVPLTKPLEVISKSNLNKSSKNDSNFDNKDATSNFNSEKLSFNQCPILFIEGVKAIEEAINYLNDVNSLYELQISSFLNKTSLEHSLDIGINGLISHDGSDGKGLVDRIEKICDWNGMLSENLEFGSTTAEEILCTWVIDDGVSLRTHRSNLFSDRYKYFGVNCTSHAKEFSVTVINFAEDLYSFNENNPFLVEKTFYVYPSKDKTKMINTYLDVDPDAPENLIQVYKSVIIKNINGKASQKTKKIYTLDDGSKIELEK